VDDHRAVLLDQEAALDAQLGHGGHEGIDAGADRTGDDVGAGDRRTSRRSRTSRRMKVLRAGQDPRILENLAPRAESGMCQ
jgi:hypothetical protein